MKLVFADSSYFLALLNRRDQAHPRAIQLAENVEQLLTTEWVLTELADGLASSRHRDMFVATRTELLADNEATVLPLGMDLQEKGIELFANRPDKEWSLTNCISFVVMKEHGISEALTGDHHFEQAGFVALMKP